MRFAEKSWITIHESIKIHPHEHPSENPVRLFSGFSFTMALGAHPERGVAHQDGAIFLKGHLRRQQPPSWRPRDDLPQAVTDDAHAFAGGLELGEDNKQGKEQKILEVLICCVL